jgi:hypothetical protein
MFSGIRMQVPIPILMMGFDPSTFLLQHRIKKVSFAKVEN